jgi:hypothetical protein
MLIQDWKRKTKRGRMIDINIILNVKLLSKGNNVDDILALFTL